MEKMSLSKDVGEYKPLAEEIIEDFENCAYIERSSRKTTRVRTHGIYLATIFLAGALLAWQYVSFTKEMSGLRGAYDEVDGRYGEALAHLHEERTPYRESIPLKK